MCSDQFAVLYSQTSKTPLIVVERLTSVQLRQATRQERTNAFFPDPRIPASSRAELTDFKDQPGIDRGHQAPAGDAVSVRAMAQSFALSNMVAQASSNNRGAWSKVESDVRKFVLRARGNVFVYTGPLFLGDHANGNVIIGRSVWVPSHLFKLVYDEASGRSWAYILPNAAASVERPMDYATFVARTGWRVLDGLSVTGSLR
ncbi:DNA/RNA non-specific endonuclease [Herbaspirillum aquaticum]|uniref:DNA/RNA non-specific endonuclease n=1 Tax=Herbaspirillum aquaticum TaxID=568783 RepID=UPI0024DE4FF4|nr:DNA/RNA non-specific endonuclease [Herbaspirillum aquaticum]